MVKSNWKNWSSKLPSRSPPRSCWPFESNRIPTRFQTRNRRMAGRKKGERMPKQKILIVDDDPDLKKGLNLPLRANHYDTVYASDGFSAVMMAQKERPNLII